jgi:hypothetical protein
VAALAAELGVSEGTVRRWKGRRDVADRASTPHRLATRFTAEEEEIAVALRRDLALSLDDTLEVMRRCLRPDISRSAQHRCFHSRGVVARPVPQRPGGESSAFETTAFGFVHIDLKHLPRLDRRPAYVFVAIERTTRFVYVEIIGTRSGAVVEGCLQRFLDGFGHPVHTVLTDNGSEITDRFGAVRYHHRDRGTGAHPFDVLCAARGIRHRLTRPYRPQCLHPHLHELL